MAVATTSMTSSQTDRFVRLSTELLETLFSTRLTGVQLRIVLWVIRNTVGWNRNLTPFSWYRIAKKIGGDRAVVWRAGQTLLEAHVLILEDGQLGVQKERRQWRVPPVAPLCNSEQQIWIPECDVANEQRQSLLASNAGNAGEQRVRCAEATVFRRAKDRCLDKIKNYIKTTATSDVTQRSRDGALNEHQHPAGAACPIPGKYDGIPKD
jgi:phage replication O-like protein O